jgi:hypothetical protein
MTKHSDHRDQSDEAVGTEPPPPFGGSWRRLYTYVLVNLAAHVLLFYIFTRAFS